MNRRRRFFCFAAFFLLVIHFAGAAAMEKTETTASIREISKYGNVELSLSGSGFLSSGYDFGDIVMVTVGNQSHDMPVGSSYSDVDDGKMICRVEINDEEDRLVLAINMGDFASAAGIAVKTAIDEEPGYRWDYLQSEDLEIAFALKEKGGYANEYHLRQLVRTNAREDYAHLTDEAFANFREIQTGGMGRGMLYRSSSPIDPQLGRNTYADAALKKAGIRTVINLADTLKGMQDYPGYSESAYSVCDVAALSLGLDVRGEAFEAGLAQGLRYLIAHDGPYLVHCTEGKDRAGFVSAILQCLMGASFQEVMTDYMTTYENYYGVEPGSENYHIIAKSNMKKTLEDVFGVQDIEAPDVNLADEAQAYLIERLRMTEDEADAIRMRLGKEK